MGFDHRPNTWGDSIQWWPDFASRQVTGWQSTRPQKGDLLRVRMQSGKVLICKFVEVEHTRDPEDMFFGRVRDVGYEGEPPFSRWPRLQSACDVLRSWWRNR
jgi:hypothetical protein